MLQVKAIPIFDDNYCWLLSDKKTKTVIVVDPGEATPVLSVLSQQQHTLSAIFITHRHRDHVAGIGALLEYFNVPVYGPKQEDITGVNHKVKEQDEITITGFPHKFKVFDVPGHTRGHVAYYTENSLFCGDTLFSGGCGRLSESTPAQMLTSIKKLIRLPADTNMYCAHEYTADNLIFAATVESENVEIQKRIKTVARLRAAQLPTLPSTLQVELETNPFVRCHTPIVKAAAERYANRVLKTEVAVFSVIRHWKDVF
ncbi:MAG: hydroxyacylglutathione hydrolase [Gammaproteobacteria bacterium]|nr:hydroxyacylglutathione hydrolase [Gammaproteobacteria bacterium]